MSVSIRHLLRPRGALLLASFGLLIVWAPGQLHAHPGHTGSERLLKLDLAAEPPRFSYGLILAPEDASSVRSAADRDLDGALDEAEAEDAQNALTREFGAKVSLCHGPSLAEARCIPASKAELLEVMGTGFDDPRAPLALSWEVALGLSDNDEVVRVTDDWERENVVSTNGRIEPRPGQPLLRAGSDPGSEKGVNCEPSWTEGSDQPRTMFAIWEPPTSKLLMPFVSGGLLVMSLGALLMLRKSRT